MSLNGRVKGLEHTGGKDLPRHVRQTRSDSFTIPVGKQLLQLGLGFWEEVVGINIHDRFGYEISVLTEAQSRGRGFVSRLVATSARWVLDHCAIPTYLHQLSTLPSAHVSEARGFADDGWHVHGL